MSWFDWLITVLIRAGIWVLCFLGIVFGVALGIFVFLLLANRL